MKSILIIIYGYLIPVIISTKPAGFNPFVWQEVVVTILMVIPFIFISKKRISEDITYLLPLGLFFFWILLNGFRATNFLVFIASISLHLKYCILLATITLAPAYTNVLPKILFPYVVLGILLIFTKGDYSTELLSSSGRFYRSAFGFTNVNVAGLFFGMLFLLIDSISFRKNYKYLSVLKFLFIVALLLTFSRRSLIFLVPVLFRNKLISLLIFIIMLFSPVAKYLQPFIMRVMTIFDPTYQSNAIRVHQIEFLVNNELNNLMGMLAGLGPGNIGPSSSFGIPYFTRLDNHLLLLFAEFGLVGLSFYIGFFILLLIRVCHGENSLLHSRLRIFILLTLITAFSGTGLLSFPISLIFWIVISFFLVYNERTLYN